VDVHQGAADHKAGCSVVVIRVHLYFHSPFPFTAWSSVSWTTVLALIVIFSPYFALLGTKIFLFSSTQIYFDVQKPPHPVCATGYEPVLFTSLCLYTLQMSQLLCKRDASVMVGEGK
jgi:hypothetical protein